jgi:hypothetical protein
MKHSFFAVLMLVLCLAGSVQKASADHMMGTEISYACTSTPGIFEITLVIYRSCSGIPVCSDTCGAACTRTLRMMGADPSCQTSTYGNVTLSLQNVRDVEANAYCPGAKNTCDNMGCVTPGTYTPAIERYEFKGFANIGPTSGIPANCCNVRFVFEECCRNGEISTGASWQNYYSHAIINRCLSVSPCNGSPMFKNDGLMVLCGGENVQYNSGAIDPDGDSLSFAFAPAMQAFNSSATYTPPFAYDRPMPWTGAVNAPYPAGIRCDPVSGDVLFTPGNASGSNFYGIIVIEITQWKKINGVPTAIGKTRRDVQSVVLANCPPNNIPRFTTTQPLPSDPTKARHNWEICAGQQLCFGVTAKDTDHIESVISDTTYLSWDSSLVNAGATFTPDYIVANRTTAGPREDSYTFCWTPHDSLVRSTPYYFTITAQDNRCPKAGKIIRAFSVKVVGLPAITIQKNKTGCAHWNFTYSASRTPHLATWKIASQPGDDSLAQSPYVFTNTKTVPPIRFSKAGKYTIQLEIADTGSTGALVCTRSYTDTILVDPSLDILLRDTSVCNTGSLTLSAGTANGTSPYTFKWYNSIRDTAAVPLNTPPYTNANLTVIPASGRNYILVVTDGNGCRAVDSLYVSVGPDVNAPVIGHIQCYGRQNGSITISKRNSNAVFSYKLNNGPVQDSGSFTNLAAGTYSITVNDTSGCSRTFSNLIVSEPAQLGESVSDVRNEVCYNTRNGSITTLATGGIAPYQYKLDSGGTYTSARTFSPLVPGAYTLFIKDSRGCEISLPKTISKTDSLSYIISGSPPVCMGSSNATITINASGGTPPYQYNINNGSYRSSNTFTNLSAGLHQIVVKDNNNCQLIVTHRILSPVILTHTSSAQNVTCAGSANGIVTITASGGVPPYTYKADSGLFDTASVKTGLKAGMHTFTIRDSLGCQLSFTQQLLEPFAIQSISTQKDASCAGRKDGSISIITTTGGFPPYHYRIGPGTPATSSVFRNLGAGTYTVAIIDNQNCENSFSRTINEPPAIIAGTISGTIAVQRNNTYQYTIPAQAGVAYSWFSDNGTVITGQATPTAEIRWDGTGTGMVYAALTRDSACGDTASLAVTIGSSGMEEYVRTIGLDVFPNPVKDLLHITVQRLPEATLIKLYDAQGKILVQQPLQQQQQILTDHLAPGVYLLQIGSWRGKVLKQ